MTKIRDQTIQIKIAKQDDPKTSFTESAVNFSKKFGISLNTAKQYICAVRMGFDSNTQYAAIIYTLADYHSYKSKRGEFEKRLQAVTVPLNSLDFRSPIDIYCELERREKEEIADSLIRGLPERERQILEYRYGLNGKRYRTLRDLSKEFGITKERVRQIEGKAIKKLQKRAKGL